MATPVEVIGNRYVLRQKLGTGGMGIVYRATDRLLGRDVALKRVNQDASDTTLTSQGSVDFRLSLAREFKISASLRHPNIVEVLDYGFGKQRQPYYTMELLENPKTIIQASRDLTINRKIHYIAQMLQALAYLHRRGILHRDLKPANVLVVNSQVKLVDFGLSVMHERVHGLMQRAPVGTLAYMAPEVLLQRPVSIATDLYAAGVIAYELITGRYPFDYNDMSQLIRRIVYDMPDLDGLDIGIDLGSVLYRLMQKDPLDRYASAFDALDELRDAFDVPVSFETQAVRDSFLQAARLIGRSFELQQLTQALTRTTRNAGGLWLLAGESGVGKSRLMDELRTQAMVRGALVIRGAASNVGNRPYEVWLPVMRWLCLLLPDMPDQDVALLLPFIPDIDQLIDRDVSAIQPQPAAPDAFHTRLTQLLEQAIKRHKRPMLILCDDLHWADSASLKMLQQLSQHITHLPVMIAATYRDDERPDIMRSFPNVPIIKLNRLAANEIAELSAAMLGDEGRMPQVVDLLQRETEGNVFFIIEVVRTLASESGGLQDIGRTTLPERVFAGGIETVIQQRLERLDPDSRSVLRLAAVMGRWVNLELLHVIVPSVPLDSWLTICANAAVLEPQDEMWYFAHDKLRQALLDSLAANHARELHQRVAEAMEKMYGDAAAYVSALAYHWGQAGDAQKEERYITLAGEQQLRIGSYDEALGSFRRAWALVETLPLSKQRRQRKQIHLNQRMGEAFAGMGDYGQARQHFAHSRDICQQLGDDIGVAVATGHLADVAFAMTDFETARTLYQQSLNIYRQQQNTAGIVRTLNGLGNVAYEMGQQDDAKTYYQESLSLSREIGEDWGMAGALRFQTVEQTVVSVDETHMTRLKQQLEAHTAVQNRQGIATTLYELGKVANEAGDVDEARQYLRKSITLYRALHDDVQASYAHELLAQLEMRQGFVDRTRQHLDDALQLAVQSADVNLVSQVLLSHAQFADEQGDYDGAVRIISVVLTDADLPEHLVDKAETLIFQLEDDMPPERMAQAWETGKQFNRDALIKQLLI